MKITAKTTKQELKNILGANVTAVKTKDKDLYDRIAYASKMAKQDDSKVTRKDLVDLVKEVMKVLGNKLVEPALAQETPTETPVEQPKAENSVKKSGKGLKSKKESVPEVVESEKTAEESQETPAKAEKVDEKKSAKKSLGKKKEQPKKDDATDSNKGTVQKEIFPETLKVEGSEYKLAHDIKTMDDLYNAVEGDDPEEIIFAFYWTKTHLKKYPYFYGMLDTPKSFENDLDLATTLWVSPEKRIAYHISMYTEGCYNTLPDDFEEVDGVRYAGTMEFQIYRAV